MCPLKLLFSVLIFNKLVFGADIYVVGISNNQKTEKTNGPAEIVNININNYCPDSSIAVFENCFCISKDECDDEDIFKFMKGSSWSNFKTSNCEESKICCYNVKKTNNSLTSVITKNENKPEFTSPTTINKEQTDPELSTSSASDSTSTTKTSTLNSAIEPETDPSLETPLTNSITLLTLPTPTATSANQPVDNSPLTPIETPTTLSDSGKTISSHSENDSELHQNSTESPKVEQVTMKEVIDVEVITVFDWLPKPSERICGTRNLHNKMYAKIMTPTLSPALPGEFPWTVSILKSDQNDDRSLVCLGSLIQPDVVLTVGNCVDSNDLDQYVLRAATNNPLNLELQKSLWQQRGIVRKVVHPITPQNDVGLLFLSTPFILNDFVNTVCLPHSRNYTTSWCAILGWNNDKGIFQRSEKRVANAEKCLKESVKNGKVIEPNVLCVNNNGFEENNTKTKFCGAGLACQLSGDNKFTQIGICVCSQTNNLSEMYFSVPVLLDWINREIFFK